MEKYFLHNTGRKKCCKCNNCMDKTCNWNEPIYCCKNCGGQGITGPTGPEGPQGPPGETGSMGPQGS